MTFFVTKVWMDYIIREKVWHKTLVATISILLLVSSLYFVFDDIGDELSRTNKFDSLVPYIALSILIPDFLLKYFVKRESLIMSDSMKTRPISTVSWNRFVLLNSLLDFWNLYLLFLLFPIAFLFLLNMLVEWIRDNGLPSISGLGIQGSGFSRWLVLGSRSGMLCNESVIISLGTTYNRFCPFMYADDIWFV